MPASANIYQSEFTGAEIDARLEVIATLQAALNDLESVVAAKYSKPATGIPSTDLDGAPRLVGGPDIGCYENQTEFRTLILLR